MWDENIQGDPDVEVAVLDVTPSIIEFTTAVDGNPEARLFAAASEFLEERADRMVVEGASFQFRLSKAEGHVQVMTLFTRYPIAGVDYNVTPEWEK